MRCFHKCLGISYKDHIIYEVMKTKSEIPLGYMKTSWQQLKRCKLRWYGHIPLSSGLAKTILQGAVHGGRPKKCWEDNINEWAGLDFNTILQKAEDREESKKLVDTSPMVPQRSPRLWDRWDKRHCWSKVKISNHLKYRYTLVYELKTFSEICPHQNTQTKTSFLWN